MADYSVPSSSSPDADLASIDAAIQSRDWLLRFPSKLGAAFERDTGAQRCRDLIIQAYIGIVIYDLFAIADWWAVPHHFWTFFLVRFGFFTPLALILTAVMHTHPRAFVRESLVCIAGGIVSIGTIIFLVAVSR